MNIQAGQARPAERTRAWAESLDAFATAGVAAAEAATTDALRSGIACALCGRFADWVIVDLTLGALATRSVASRGPQAELAAALEQMPARDCPPIISAMRRQTPVIKPFVTSPAELGVLPGGRAVAAALRAGSYAVGPVVSGGFAIGAITVIREVARPRVSFLELAVLAYVGELTEGALKRMGTR